MPFSDYSPLIFLLKYSWYTSIQYGDSQFLKLYFIYSCCTIYACSLFYICLYLLIPTPILPPPTGNHSFILYIHESAFLLYSLVCCIFSIPQKNDITQYLSLAYFTQHNTLQVHPCCISLMINDVEHLFMHLLYSLLISAQPVSFTTNCLFFNFRIFKTRKNKMVISYVGTPVT